MALTEQDLQEISTLLSPLQNEIQDMRQDMQDMKVDMQDMKLDMQDMKLDMQDMSKRITSLEVHIENETDRNIQRLFI